MSSVRIGDDTYEVITDQFEVTSLSRPDTAWHLRDSHGHEHRWFTNGAPATEYRPDQVYVIQTLNYVEDYPATEDYPAVFHYECRECGEQVEPGVRPDDSPQYVPGIRHYYINGQSVSPDEFAQRTAHLRQP